MPNATAPKYDIDKDIGLTYGSTLAAVKAMRQKGRGKQDLMQAYAVIETGGKQYLVKEGSVVDVEQLDAQPGSTVDIERVLAVSDGNRLKVGTPVVSGAKVTAKVVEVFRGKKLVVFKKKRRKGYHKKAGHRQSLMKLQVTGISA